MVFANCVFIYYTRLIVLLKELYVDRIRCRTCGGNGELLGGGMMMIDCPACHGLGMINVDATKAADVPKELISIDRRSRAYRDAITKIMETHKCSREEASMVFDEEFDKL
jgi:hypothetical protein